MTDKCCGKCEHWRTGDDFPTDLGECKLEDGPDNTTLYDDGQDCEDFKMADGAYCHWCNQPFTGDGVSAIDGMACCSQQCKDAYEAIL
jgi:hypothetical protein